MTIPSLKEKLFLLGYWKNELDPFIKEVFDSYIKENNINFKYPEHWDIEEDNIIFKGEDGCHGVYSSMTLQIPIEYVENYKG